MNLLTLTFLLGLLAADGDEPQAKQAPPAVPQDPDRPAITATDLKALRDTNIFAPKSIKRRPPPTLPTNPRNLPPTPYKQKSPVVTAIFLDLASQSHQVIVEDRNDSSHRYFKEPKFMKAGDEWAGVKVESITQDVAVFSKDGTSKEVHIGEPLPESEAKPLTSADGSDEGIGDDGETPLPAESSTSPSTSKYRKMAPESKTQTSEEQNRVLEEMRRKNKKKNRPGAEE